MLLSKRGLSNIIICVQAQQHQCEKAACGIIVFRNCTLKSSVPVRDIKLENGPTKFPSQFPL